MPRSSSLLLATVVALCLTACSGSDDEPDSGEPLPNIDAARNAELPVRPGDFCDRINPRAVEMAIGDDPQEAHYGNGDEAEVAPGVVDVAHEFGCVLTATDGSQVRAWVAVPPVTRKQARRITAGDDCTDAGQGLGAPGFAATCTTKRTSTTTLAGLYTDTWFGCSLTTPATGSATDTDDSGDPDGSSTGDSTSASTPGLDDDKASKGATPTAQERLETWCAAAVQAAATAP